MKLNDVAVSESTNDCFEMSKYVEGLSQFILECPTPMTIAIQGDWGSGKTSMMNMVRKKLPELASSDNKIKPITADINTWIFPQFGREEELEIMFLCSIISELTNQCTEDLELTNLLTDAGKENEEKDLGKVKNLIKMAKYVVQQASIIGVDSVFGNRAGDEMEKLWCKIFKKNGDNEKKNDDENAEGDLPTISTLRISFKDLVSTITENEQQRVVLFVDDLDRLKPSKAVDLLEILKNFLDCERCVFVLAIDYNVIVQGTRSKYGNDFSEEKSKQFFEKIIQVPFNIPIAEYKLNEYIKHGLEVDREEQINEISSLLELSVGLNPRRIKRIFNQYKLTKLIIGDKTWSPDDVMLIAALCVQNAYNAYYDKLVRMGKKELPEELEKDETECVESDNKEKLRFAETLNDFKEYLSGLLMTEDRISKFIDALHYASTSDYDGQDMKITRKKYYVKCNISGNEGVQVLEFVEKGMRFRGIPALICLLARAYVKNHSIEDFNAKAREMYVINAASENETPEYKACKWKSGEQEYILKSDGADFKPKAFEMFIEKLELDHYVAGSIEELNEKNKVVISIEASDGYAIVKMR